MPNKKDVSSKIKNPIPAILNKEARYMGRLIGTKGTKGVVPKSQAHYTKRKDTTLIWFKANHKKQKRMMFARDVDLL